MKVLTDHKGLEYFMTTKKLTLRQVRWTKFLLEFNFVISYQNGKKNDKANALIRKSNKQPTNDENKWRKHSVRMLLPPNQINHEAELQSIEEDHANQTNSNTDFDVNDKTSPLPERVIEFNWVNKLCSEIRSYLANPKRLDKPDAYLKGLRVENGLLMKGNQLWVANESQLQLEIIKKSHNQLAVGHSGMEKTLKMARRHYYWLGMKEMIQQFINNYHVCKQAKAAWNIYHSLLQPVPVPEQAWIDIIMNFVVGLPKCKAYGQIYDAILMVIDWLSKERHYIPCSEEDERTSVEATADLFFQGI